MNKTAAISSYLAFATHEVDRNISKTEIQAIEINLLLANSFVLLIAVNHRVGQGPLLLNFRIPYKQF